MFDWLKKLIRKNPVEEPKTEPNRQEKPWGAGGEGRRSDPGDAVVQRGDREGMEQAAVEPEQICPGVLPAND